MKLHKAKVFGLFDVPEGQEVLGHETLLARAEAGSARLLEGVGMEYQ
jgi:hypothetical protein